MAKDVGNVLAKLARVSHLSRANIRLMRMEVAVRTNKNA